MQIFTYTFNRICVNTYLLLAADGTAVLIDPGCSTPEEEMQLQRAVTEKGARVAHILLTHAHADHIQGCEWAKKFFPEAVLAAHADCSEDYRRANAYGSFFGFSEHRYPPFDRRLQHGDVISFGEEKLKVLHTPGHARGSVCYHQEESGVLFSGDTLFCQSVGRTDLPGGSQQDLLQSIQNILKTLPDETTVCCGHGESTTIGEEKRYNPYF